MHRIEPVKIVYPDGKVRITPELEPRQMLAHTSYINSCTGLKLSTPATKDLLERMSLPTEASTTNPDELLVSVPATRPDILHECDLMEDAAIAYGFNNLPDTFPATSTVAQPLAVSKLSDIIRHEWAYAGWVEVLPLILVGPCPLLISYSSHLPARLIAVIRTFSARTKRISNFSTSKTTTRPRSRSVIPRRSSSRSCARHSYPVSSRPFARTGRMLYP